MLTSENQGGTGRMDNEARVYKRLGRLLICAAVGSGFCVHLEGCGSEKSARESVEPVLARSTAPADRDGGQKDFASYCRACHGSEGQGSDSGPPLSGSPWAIGPPSRLIRILLHGVRGPIDVGGGLTYNREMPGFGPILSDARIADLVTFVQHNFGGAIETITAESVAEIRFATRDRPSYWTAEELLADSP